MKTVYTTTETEATLSEFVLQTDALQLDFDVIIPATWYSYPMIDAARNNVSERAYNALTAYDEESGWYELSVDMLTQSISSQHSVTLTTPFDYTTLNWSASLGEDAPLRKILTPQNADAEEATVFCKLFTSMTPDDGDEDWMLKTSRTATWIVRPAQTGDEDPEPTHDESTVDSDSQKGLLSRILHRE